MAMREPLLRRRPAEPANGGAAGPSQSRFQWPDGKVPYRSIALCAVYVVVSASGPILLDWVKRANGGTFPFMVPALTFHAWATASALGVGTAVAKGREGIKQLNQPNMIWRFMLTTTLFTCGDILSFTSMQHLDVGTFSLVGKAFAIAITVGLTRVVLGKRQTRLQYGLVVAVVVATIGFCRSEMVARGHASGGGFFGTGGEWPESKWFLGLGQRTAAVAMTSLGAVLQERLLTMQPGIPFMMQQCWMGMGAMAMSFFALRVLHHLPTSALFTGFDDWRVLVLLAMYTINGLCTGLMIKQLGAVAKALCVPIYLGGCYAYAVKTGSAGFTLQVLLAWGASTACILLFAVSKAGYLGNKTRMEKDVLPK